MVQHLKDTFVPFAPYSPIAGHFLLLVDGHLRYLTLAPVRAQVRAALLRRAAAASAAGFGFATGSAKASAKGSATASASGAARGVAAASRGRARRSAWSFMFRLEELG